MLTDVFVPLFGQPDETNEVGLPALARLLDVFAGHVTYCGVEANVPDLADRWGAQLASLPKMAAEMEQRSRSRAETFVAAAMAVPGKFRSQTTRLRAAFLDPGQAVAAASRHHDITLLQLRPGSEMGKAVAEHILFGSGRPLLIAPADAELPAALDRIVIAWDGSQSASRAVYDAMPIITRASDVAILTAGDDKPISSQSVDALSGYLQRHGVTPRMARAASSRQGIGSDLQSAAMAEQAQLLVMGGYGHSRLREFILGGATVGVLSRPALPILLSR
jgi:nucleotide-binding universal stress UspA family protein